VIALGSHGGGKGQVFDGGPDGVSFAVEPLWKMWTPPNAGGGGDRWAHGSRQGAALVGQETVEVRDHVVEGADHFRRVVIPCRRRVAAATAPQAKGGG